jgi:hypothetical protein
MIAENIETNLQAHLRNFDEGNASSGRPAQFHEDCAVYTGG